MNADWSIFTSARRLASKILLSQGVGISIAPSEAQLKEVISKFHPVRLDGITFCRLGNENDGGYVVPEILDGIKYCLSPGVDITAGFERDLQSRGIESHLIDFSVERAPEGFSPKSFTRKFLGATTHNHFSTLSDWMSEIGIRDSDELLLQMDVEGAEYATILNTPRSVLKQFKIMIFELHFLPSLAHGVFFELFREFAEILTQDHKVVHLHPNNFASPVKIRKIEVYPAIEVTLVRSDVIGHCDYAAREETPVAFDRPNLPMLRSFSLSDDWYHRFEEA